MDYIDGKIGMQRKMKVMLLELDIIALNCFLLMIFCYLYIVYMMFLLRVNIKTELY